MLLKIKTGHYKCWSKFIIYKKNYFRIYSLNLTTMANSFRLIDIGANLTDEMYLGLYNESKKHDPDLPLVLQRAWNVGVDKIFVTSGNLEEAKKALELAQTDDRLYSTVGVHPTRCGEFQSDSHNYMTQLKSIVAENKGKIIAIGEFGLDYDRTKFCEADIQRKYFESQLLELAQHSDLPLFLHCRNAADDLCKLLNENKNCIPRGGVVHSFDGSLEEMSNFVKLGLHIGINGCSLKTEDNLKVVKEIPVEKLLLETDSPWCSVRPSHAGSKFMTTKFEAAKKNWNKDTMYKTRNEPQTILNVLEIVAGVKDMDMETLASKIYENTMELFFKP